MARAQLCVRFCAFGEGTCGGCGRVPFPRQYDKCSYRVYRTGCTSAQLWQITQQTSTAETSIKRACSTSEPQGYRKNELHCDNSVVSVHRRIGLIHKCIVAGGLHHKCVHIVEVADGSYKENHSCASSETCANWAQLMPLSRVHAEAKHSSPVGFRTRVWLEDWLAWAR